MKIKCFLAWAFLTFLLFSCSYELEGPPPFEATALDNFGVADARCYFEENAGDLSYVRFCEHQHHPSTRSEEEGYPELSPDWSHAVRTENTEAVLVEVPIRAEQVMLSVIRHFEDGKFRLSRVCESRVRLMIARRNNGQTQMFVTTLVPSAKYPPREQDIENFRYLGGGNFTGKVFCSTLDGHFVEASQYVNGRFVGMLDVTTRKQLSERGESLEGTSYESIMLSSAVKTKSGTYFFSEGGSSYTTCPYHPQYIAGSCPYCLDEVIVRSCQYCGARLENGQTCNCRNCSRCGYYPCRCCNYCLRYPCSCVSQCVICRPYSCTKCNECGRHYCFGACKQTGNEEKLPGGDTGSGNIDGAGTTPFLDKICSSNTLISTSEKKQIEEGIDFLKKTYPKASALFSVLENSGVQITIAINPNMSKGVMKYNYSTHTLYFLGAQYGNSFGALEDWAHVVQCEVYYKSGIPSNRTLEFEAKMFCDLNCFIVGEQACALLDRGFGEDGDAFVMRDHIQSQVQETGKFTSDLLNDYYELGKKWNDPDYQSGMFEEKIPLLLMNLMK